jgi:hypothetical protein
MCLPSPFLITCLVRANLQISDNHPVLRAEFGLSLQTNPIMPARRKSAFLKLGAYLCLLAAGVLQAPLAAAAWNLSSMSCCTGDHCPLHHRHQKTQAPEVDCEHDAYGMTACSMDCCQTSEKVALTALAFVLPVPRIAVGGSAITRAVEILQTNELRLDREPLAPPPRFTAVIL